MQDKDLVASLSSVS